MIVLYIVGFFYFKNFLNNVYIYIMVVFVKIVSELYKKRIIWDRYKNIYNVFFFIVKY